jgi:hypothetical protein
VAVYVVALFIYLFSSLGELRYLYLHMRWRLAACSFAAGTHLRQQFMVWLALQEPFFL